MQTIILSLMLLLQHAASLFQNSNVNVADEKLKIYYFHY